MTPSGPSTKAARLKLSRRALVLGAGAASLAVLPWYLSGAGKAFPPDTTVEGVYLRVALAIHDDRIADMFAYLETEAQWGCFTILELKHKAFDLVMSSYPEGERESVLPGLRMASEVTTAPDLFALEAKARGWVTRMRRDLSGHKSMQIEGERATLETTRGTRYAFRRRENGIWGLTMFTAELRAEAERAARDLTVIERAAQDYGARK
jgi:hypothetical protein